MLLAYPLGWGQLLETLNNTRGTPKTAISSGGWAPSSTGEPARWVFYDPLCTSVPAGIVVRNCVQLQWIFLKTLSTRFPISWWVIYKCPYLHPLSVQQFLTKNGVTPMPHPPYSSNLAPSNFFLFPWMKKVLKGRRFAEVEEVKQKSSRSTKRHQNRRVQNLFWAVEKTSL